MAAGGVEAVYKARRPRTSPDGDPTCLHPGSGRSARGILDHHGEKIMTDISRPMSVWTTTTGLGPQIRIGAEGNHGVEAGRGDNHHHSGQEIS